MRRRRTALLASTASALCLATTFGFAQPPSPPEQLFGLKLANEARSALTTASVVSPNLDLAPLGDGRNIIVATGNGPLLPRLFFGLCKGPCGFVLSDRKRRFDLTGRANIKVTTVVSGFHRVRPVIRQADGSVLICDQAEGSTADFHTYEISFADCRWLKLDAVRGVTLGATWKDADLRNVDAVGVFDVIPGSGEWLRSGEPVEKQPPPPAGGWIAVSSFELWGKSVARD
jgi:hypothetical protein